MASAASSVHSIALPDRTPAHIGLAVGLVSRVLERTRDFPGRVADARRLTLRLHRHRAELERRLNGLRCDARNARVGGRDFCERRAVRSAAALSDELCHADALLVEMARVRRRLARERRGILRRITVCERIAAGLPDTAERTRLLTVIADARLALQTFTRGDAKH